MQSPQHQNEKSRSFRELSIPIRFTCLVNEAKTEVSITHEDNTRRERAFRLTFSDGHMGVFFLVEGTPYWHEEGTGPSSHALAVSDDLNAVSQFDLQSAPIVIQVARKSRALNVWIWPRSGVYEVYYDSDHRFSVYEKELGWGRSSVGRHHGYIDEEIQAIVEHHLTTRNGPEP
jgi:hypothetical protein